MKLKIKNSFSKRFRFKPNGYFKRICSHKRHNLYLKSNLKKTYLSKKNFLSKSDFSLFKKFF